ATPMFLSDAAGPLVFYNEAAELLIGRPFAEVGEMPALDFGDELALSDSDGSPLRRRDTPAGIAFFERRPAHKLVVATGYDGVRRRGGATAHPLFGAAGGMHGGLTALWDVRAGAGGGP